MKKQYLNLLLLADEQESIIDKYLERGEMIDKYLEQESIIDKYLECGEMIVLSDKEVIAECVVTDEDKCICELKNIATAPEYK